MPPIQIAIVLALLIVCGFAPGFFFVRRLPWNPMEKLCGSIGLSLILVYLTTWAYYCFVPNAGVWAYAGVSAVSLALGIVASKDIARLVRSFRIRQALFGYAFLLAWMLVILGMIRVYSGAGWGGDWAEHFQRTLFFLHRFPLRTPIVTGYELPARPPLMNVLAAFFLAQTRDRFEIFQVVYTFLNLLMFLPCCLIMPAIAGRRPRSILPLVALFALNPVVMQADTYTWPRGLTAFFVVSAIAFYLAGWRKNDPVRMTAAFVAMSAGFLAHYSAGPYAVFIGLHYMTCVWRRRAGKWRELSAIALICGLLLATWFGWSISTYGLHSTFGSNSTVLSSQSYQGSTAGRIASNIYHSVVPAIVRQPSLVHFFDQVNSAGFIRDNAFIFQESNVIFSMGLTGGPLVLWLLYRYWRRGGLHSQERRFWAALIPFCIVLGIAVVGEADRFGVAHATLLSLEVLGLTMLAGAFPLRKVAAVILLAGCAVDFSMGILLHARIEGMETGIAVSGPESLNLVALASWQQKHEFDLSQEMDLRALAAINEAVWQGWYRQHGGSMVFLGDHLAGLSFDGNNTLQVVLFILLGCLLGALWKQRHLLF
jgi:hypothetical protein